MHKSVSWSALLILCGALVMGGCAKRQAVRGEEVPPPTTTAKPAETAPPTPPPGESVTQPQPIQESKVPEGQAEEGAARQAEAALQKVFFDYDSFALSSEARDILSKDANFLSKHKSMKVQLEGHTDERGSDEYNLALGEKRAKAALNYLVSLGVSPQRLSVISYGKEKPAVPGSNEEAWAKNRRVQFAVTSR